MSYSWTGPPAQFNGTDDITGGDSGESNFPCHFAHVPSNTPASCATYAQPPLGHSSKHTG